MSGPLSGMKLVEFAAVLSAPMATMWLADQGADVVKIEKAGGDVTRQMHALSRASAIPSGRRIRASPPERRTCATATSSAG